MSLTDLGLNASPVRTLVAEYEHFTVLNVYFPNGKASEERLRYKMDFYEAFLPFLDKIQLQGKNALRGDGEHRAQRDRSGAP